jgi:hypothetical protein
MGWHNAAVQLVRAAIRGSQKILLDETLLSGTKPPCADAAFPRTRSGTDFEAQRISLDRPLRGSKVGHFQTILSPRGIPTIGSRTLRHLAALVLMTAFLRVPKNGAPVSSALNKCKRWQGRRRRMAIAAETTATSAPIQLIRRFMVFAFSVS